MVEESAEPLQHDWQVPFAVPSYRFDQTNEVFKRARWEEQLKPLARIL